jgi:hypothetical protein
VVIPPESVIDSTVQVPTRKSKALRAEAADVSEDACKPWAVSGTSGKEAMRAKETRSVRRNIRISGSGQGIAVPGPQISRLANVPESF